jgi:hypothetical protein
MNDWYIFGAWLMHSLMVQVEVQVGAWLMYLFMVQLITGCLVQVGAWLMHLFMVQVDYRLFGTGWCMVDALFYGIG